MKKKSKSSPQQLKANFQTSFGSLYKADCINALQMVPDNSVHCIFADPPFNLGKEYGNGRSDDLAENDYLDWTRRWIELCSRKLNDGGAFYIFNLPKWSIPTAGYLAQNGLTFRNWIVVDLTLSLPINNRLYPAHYALLYFIKGKKASRFSPPRLPLDTCRNCGHEMKDYGGYKSKLNPLGLTLSDVWNDIPPVRHSINKNRKANQLSVKLLDRVLDISTKPGDTVLDPFAGSGTTLITCELKKRRWIGIEIGECKTIRDRFKAPQQDSKNLQNIHTTKNVLFTDKALSRRSKKGIALKGYRILPAQKKRLSLNN